MSKFEPINKKRHYCPVRYNAFKELFKIHQHESLNANFKSNPQACVFTKKTVTSKSVLKLNSVAGGGFAISILAQ